MRRRRRIWFILGVGCLISSAASWAHGTPDQTFDPVSSGGYYCPGGRMLQSFTPSRRLLEAVDLRLGIGPEYPASGITARVQVRRGSIDGQVVGTSTSAVGAGREPYSQSLVHFDFNPSAVLDPKGEYFIEWEAPPGLQLYWIALNDGSDTGYSGGSGWLCSFGVTTGPTRDLNFVTYTAPDGAPPETRITLAPAPVRPQRDPIATFEFTGTDDLSYPENLKFACAVDTGPFAPCNDGNVDVRANHDGEYTLRVRSIDQAGAVDPTPAKATWIVDRTRPEVRATSSAAAGAFQSIVISASDNVDSKNQLKVFVSIDAGPFKLSASTVRVAKSRHPHRVRVFALDRAGNRSRILTLSVRG